MATCASKLDNNHFAFKVCRLGMVALVSECITSLCIQYLCSQRSHHFMHKQQKCAILSPGPIFSLIHESICGVEMNISGRKWWGMFVCGGEDRGVRNTHNFYHLVPRALLAIFDFTIWILGQDGYFLYR